MDIEDAEHEEIAPNAPTHLVGKLNCSLVGKARTIKILPGSITHRAYGRDEVTEQFACNYGFNPQFRHKFEKGRYKITGVDVDGEAIVMELSDHTFHVSTLFIPQISSQPGSPHPLITSYLKAALSFQSKEKKIAGLNQAPQHASE